MLASISFFYLLFSITDAASPRIAVIGEGVIGVSSALAILMRNASLNVTIFHHERFEQITSFGPAGLFRLDEGIYRKWGKASFSRFAHLNALDGGRETGVQLVSGHILSTNLSKLLIQNENYGDIVYNFHFLNTDELRNLVPYLLGQGPAIHAIHYTAYTTEGRTYVPWLKKQVQRLGGVFKMRTLASVEELYEEFDVIVNCAGLNGSHLSRDDHLGVFPIRGVIFEANATWQKHFFYRDFDTFTIPTTKSVFVGSVKQLNNSNCTITDVDRRDIWQRYRNLQPAFKNVEILSEWCGLRPGRTRVRLEKTIRPSKSGANVTIVHNYGHGGNGFTLSWGCAMEVADLVLASVNT